MINHNYKRLVNTFGLVDDKELDMIGCSLIIVLRDILVCSIMATTFMQGLYINCLEVNLFCMSCREKKSKKESKEQKLIQASTTPDP